MANQPPAGRWMRMATLRPMPNPAQDPPSPQPPAPRPVLGRTFTAVPFRPAVPVPAMPPAAVVAPPPPQVTTTLPAVTAIRPLSVRPAAVTNGAPSPQRSPISAPGTIVGQSPLRPPPALMPNIVPSPKPAPPPITADVMPSPPKTRAEPTASPARQTPTTFEENGGQRQPRSPQVNAPPTTRTTTPPSPISRAPPPPHAPNFFIPKAPSQKSPQQPSTGYTSPAASPSPQKQTVTSPKFTSTPSSAPAPRMVTFSDVQTFSSPTKSPVNPPAAAPRIPSPKISPPNTSNFPDRTPPQSPQTLSVAPPPSPLHLPPPQLLSDPEKSPKIPTEPEQKSVLFQQTPEKHKPSPVNGYNKPHADSIPDQKTPQTTKDQHPHRKHSDPDNIGRSIITIAGENRGALMDLGRPRTTHPQFPGNPHKLTSPNSKIGGSESDQSSGSNGKQKTKDSISAPMKAFMNSNVQGINNSMMFNSTVTHHDPGVHVALSRKHKGHGGRIRHYKEHTDVHEG